MSDTLHVPSPLPPDKPVIVVKLLFHPLFQCPTIEQYLCPIQWSQYEVLICLILNGSMLRKNAGGEGRGREVQESD